MPVETASRAERMEIRRRGSALLRSGMRRALWLPLVLACACHSCSGNDARRNPQTPQPPAQGSGSATAAALPTTAGALSESTVASYWTTPDEIEGAAKFSLEDYAASKA